MISTPGTPAQGSLGPFRARAAGAQTRRQGHVPGGRRGRHATPSTIHVGAAERYGPNGYCPHLYLCV